MVQTFNSEAWHFRLANFGSKRIWVDEQSNICEYTRAVLAGLFCMIFASFVVALVAGLVAFTLANTFSWMFLGYQLSDLSLAVWCLVAMWVAIITLITAVSLYMDYRRDQRQKRRELPPTPPTFVGAAYDKFKNKTCFIVEFK
jgi:hypothetical protein